jgi:hypothetical protein
VYALPFQLFSLLTQAAVVKTCHSERTSTAPPVISVPPHTLPYTLFWLCLHGRQCNQIFSCYNLTTISGSAPLTPLTVQGIMCVWEYKHKLYQSLPKIHTIINFHGELVGVEDGITIIHL